MKILCEICGNSDIIKVNGEFVCQNCGCKYSVEEIQNLFQKNMVTNNATIVTSDEKQLVEEKTEESGFDFLDNIAKIYKASENSNYDEVIILCEDFLEFDDQNADVLFIYGKAVLNLVSEDKMEESYKKVVDLWLKSFELERQTRNLICSELVILSEKIMKHLSAMDFNAPKDILSIINQTAKNTKVFVDLLEKIGVENTIFLNDIDLLIEFCEIREDEMYERYLAKSEMGKHCCNEEFTSNCIEIFDVCSIVLEQKLEEVKDSLDDEKNFYIEEIIESLIQGAEMAQDICCWKHQKIDYIKVLGYGDRYAANKEKYVQYYKQYLKIDRNKRINGYVDKDETSRLAIFWKMGDLEGVMPMYSHELEKLLSEGSVDRVYRILLNDMMMHYEKHHKANDNNIDKYRNTIYALLYLVSQGANPNIRIEIKKEGHKYAIAYTLLSVCCKKEFKGREIIAEMLINYGTSIYDTGLLYSCTNPEITRLLLKNGADLNKLLESFEGEGILGQFDTDILKVYVEFGADVNKDSPILHCKNSANVKVLIEAGANIHVKNKKKQNLLFVYDDIEILEILICAGLDVNEKDENGFTPIYFCKNIEKMKLLVKHGANIDSLVANGSVSPLLYYKNYLSKEGREYVEMANYLESIGAAKPKMTSRIWGAIKDF